MSFLSTKTKLKLYCSFKFSNNGLPLKLVEIVKFNYAMENIAKFECNNKVYSPRCKHNNCFTDIMNLCVGNFNFCLAVH